MEADVHPVPGLSRKATTIFGLLDLVLAWMPLVFWFLVCLVLALYSGGLGGGVMAYILLLGAAAVFWWLARGVCWAIRWRRESDFPESNKQSVQRRLAVLLVLGVVANVWAFIVGGIEAGFGSTIVTMGFIYTPVRHFLLMHHDRLHKLAEAVSD